MKAHFIPQFYLKGFTDPDTPEGHEPFVWVYDINAKTWERRAPVNVASKPDYYLLPKVHGQADDFLERFLSRTESLAANILRGRILTKAELTAEDRAGLSVFVSLMMLRVPSVHERIGGFMVEVARRTLEMDREQWIRDPESLRKFKERYKQETGKDDLDNLKAEDIDPSLDIRAKPHVTVALAMAQVLEVAQVIGDMNWSFAHSGGNDYFVTSDHPFNMVNPKLRGGFYGPGLMQDDIEVTLPLTRHVALFAGWKEGFPPVIEVERKFVSQVNRHSCGNSQEFLYSPKMTFPDSDAILAFLTRDRGRPPQ